MTIITRTKMLIFIINFFFFLCFWITEKSCSLVLFDNFIIWIKISWTWCLFNFFKMLLSYSPSTMRFIDEIIVFTWTRNRIIISNLISFSNRYTWASVFSKFIISWTNRLFYLLFIFLSNCIIRTFLYWGSDFICTRLWNIIYFFFFQSFSNCDTFSSWLRSFVFTRPNCLLDFLLMFYSNCIVWTFLNCWLNLISSRLRNIVNLFFLISFSNCNAFSFIFSMFIFTWPNCMFYFLFTLLTNWISWTLNYRRSDFIRAGFWDIILLYICYSLSDCNSFASILRCLIFSWSNCYFNILLSFLTNWKLRTFNYCWSNFISTWFRSVINIILSQSFANCDAFSSIFLHFVFSRSHSLLNLLLSLFSNRIRWTFNNLTFNFVFSWSRYMI